MRHQTTTHIGIYSIFGGFLNVFEDTKLQQFQEVLSGLTFGEIFSILIPFAIGAWAILHNEDNLDTYKTSKTTEGNRGTVHDGNGSREQDGQRFDDSGAKILD